MQIKVLSILVPCSEIYHEKYLGYTDRGWKVWQLVMVQRLTAIEIYIFFIWPFLKGWSNAVSCITYLHC